MRLLWHVSLRAVVYPSSLAAYRQHSRRTSTTTTTTLLFLSPHTHLPYPLLPPPPPRLRPSSLPCTRSTSSCLFANAAELPAACVCMVPGCKPPPPTTHAHTHTVVRRGEGGGLGVDEKRWPSIPKGHFKPDNWPQTASIQVTHYGVRHVRGCACMLLSPCLTCHPEDTDAKNKINKRKGGGKSIKQIERKIKGMLSPFKGQFTHLLRPCLARVRMMCLRSCA